VATFLHIDVHELSGDLQGLILVVETITLDLCTGDGFLTGEADFAGTVLGSEPGAARMSYHGELRAFVFIENGHFIMTDGEDGLAGVHAWSFWDFTAGVGGTYDGLAHFDERP
jgi:hypothetical protein